MDIISQKRPQDGRTQVDVLFVDLEIADHDRSGHTSWATTKGFMFPQPGKPLRKPIFVSHQVHFDHLYLHVMVIHLF